MVTVPNGSVDYVNGTTFLGSEIAYTCTKNYRLIGTTRRYCLDNGAWSDATPKCEGNLDFRRSIKKLNNRKIAASATAVD